MIEVGNIVYFKNIIFEESKIDHSFNKGRPCVFLGELDNKMYFMPLSNVTTAKKYHGHHIKPNRENELKKVSHLCIRELLEKPMAWYNFYGYLDDVTLDDIFDNIYKFHNKIDEDKSRLLIKLYENYISSKKKYIDKDKINKNNRRNK